MMIFLSQIVTGMPLQYGSGCSQPDPETLTDSDPNQWVNLYEYLQRNQMLGTNKRYSMWPVFVLTLSNGTTSNQYLIFII